MNIDRSMANLFFQIKRSIPFESRDQMKLASPNIGKDLITLYNSSEDQSLRALIKEFLRRAGDDWISQLGKSNKSSFISSALGGFKH